MYVIEHALLNLGKNKGRNILLGVIILAIITTTVVALGIYNTSERVLDETRAAIVSIEQDAVPGQVGGGQKIISGQPSENTSNAEVQSYKKTAERVESLNRLSLTFLIIVLVLGAVIMALLSAIAVRERKYEIGVLRAMGMKKGKVALGLWTEIIAVTCICFAIGMFVGSAVAQPVSDAIMSGQAQANAPSSSTLSDRLSGTEASAPEKLDVSVSGTTALEIFGVSILLATISGAVSVSRITKSEPIKILMDRN